MSADQTEQKKAMQAAMERWAGVVREQVLNVEKAVGKSSLTPDEAFKLWHRLRRNAIEAVEKVVADATVRRFNGQEPSCLTCTSGVCCNSRVDVVLADAVPILQHLEESGGLTPKFLEACRERNRAELMAGHPKTWLEKRKPCLFLRDGRCSVYAARPVPCAQFYAWSDPVYCLDMEPGSVVALVSPPQKMLYIALGGLHDRLLGTFDPGFRGTTLPGALWVMGSAWSRRNEPRDFRREVRRLIRKTEFSLRNTIL